jgi:hypothetical protein
VAAAELLRLGHGAGGEAVSAALGDVTTFPDVVQRSDEWYDQRRGMITASVVGQLLTAKTLAVANNDTSRGLVALLAAERITGHTDLTSISYDMLRGIEDEPRAVDVYSEHHAPVTPCGFMVRTWGRFRLGYSPDGLVGADGLVEVKSRRGKKQVETVIDGQVPSENVAQCQAALFVSGRQWLDYVSYSAGMHLWTVRVTPDPRWFTAIAAAVEACEDAITATVAAYREAVEGLPLTERPVEDMVI